MSALRRSGIVVLTLFFIAVFSAFAWPDEGTPHSFRVVVSAISISSCSTTHHGSSASSMRFQGSGYGREDAWLQR